jgi:hypothetical protein
VCPLSRGIYSWTHCGREQGGNPTYDELERSVTEKSKEDLPLWGRFAIVLGILVSLGIVGVAVAVFAVLNQVSHIANEVAYEVQREMAPGSATTAAEMVERYCQLKGPGLNRDSLRYAKTLSSSSRYLPPFPKRSVPQESVVLSP